MKAAAAVVIIRRAAGAVLGVSRPHDHDDFGPRRSEEGVVAWVSWEQLGRGTYGDYNRRIAATLRPCELDLLEVAIVDRHRSAWRCPS